MKSISKISVISLSAILLITTACSKKESVVNEKNAESKVYPEAKTDSVAEIAKGDVVSSAATIQVKDKQFVKKASVDMEVNDVYQSTVNIEKKLIELGGFVTSSNLQSEVVSEETFPVSDDKATIVKKYQTRNVMEVRVPTLKLGEFLEWVNKEKLFLNSRVITAEDVTGNIKLAELERKRLANTQQNIQQLNPTKDRVNMANDNASEQNQQEVASYEIADNLKYSTIALEIKEPSERVAEIAIANYKNADNKYRYNFFFEIKNALIKGGYMVQEVFVFLISIWPFLLIGGAIFYIFKKRKKSIKINTDISKE